MHSERRESRAGIEQSNHDALEAAYLAFAPRLARAAFLMVGDRETAKELTNEVFVRVGLRLRFIRDWQSIESYLYRTLTNLAFGHFRRLRRERHFMKSKAHLLIQRDAPTDGDAVSAEWRDSILRALSRLPPRQRQAIILRYYLELTEAEMSDAMRCSQGTVKSSLSRGRQAMRRLLEETGDRRPIS